MKSFRLASLTFFVMAWFLFGTTAISANHDTKKDTAAATTKQKRSKSKSADIAVAVKAAADKDCGCGECAAKGCKPCHGKNCFYCAAKSLVTDDCGCGMCDAKGCDGCGPGCDVCKFHLAPIEKAKKSGKPRS